MERRNFLKLAASMSVGFGIYNLPTPIHAALKKIDSKKIPKIIYLHGLSCTGCSISLLQTLNPSPVSMITKYSNLVFHSDLSAASGKIASDLLDGYFSGKNGEYFLALEGAIPAGMPEACVFGDSTLMSILNQAFKTMNGAIAVGTCASNGGIPAAEGNLTGAVTLDTYMKQQSCNKLLIEIPGCPIHPDWLWQTIIHLVKVGVPELSDKSPSLFYKKNVHELCNRYHYYQEQMFAKKLGEDQCLFKIGCNGPNSFADCPTRWWNNNTSWCVNTNAPCIGCVSKDFSKKKNIPLYRINEINQAKDLKS